MRSREASIFADRSGQGMTLGPENRHPRPGMSFEAGGSPGKPFLCSRPCARGLGCRVERGSGPARAGSNHHRRLFFVWLERSGISIGSDTRACFPVLPSPPSESYPSCLFNHSRCSPGGRLFLFAGYRATQGGVLTCFRRREDDRICGGHNGSSEGLVCSWGVVTCRHNMFHRSMPDRGVGRMLSLCGQYGSGPRLGRKAAGIRARFATM